MADEVIDAHLLRCENCRAFADAVAGQHRRSRVRSAGAVPDLTGQILARLEATTPARGGAEVRGRRWHPAGGRVGRPVLRAVATVAAVVLIAAIGFAGGGVLSSRVHHRARPATAAGPVVTGNGVGGLQADTSIYPGATVMAQGAPKPMVTLVDTAGQAYDLAAATAHRVTLLYFGYTHCPDLCPITMALAAAAVRELPAAVAAKVTVVFITTDPARDTPEVIRAWLDNFNPGFVGLTGSVGAIHAAEEEVDMPLSYAVTAASTSSGGDYRVVHAGYTLVYSQDGRAHLQVDDTDHPAELAATIVRLVDHGFQETK
jgi:protein SCO1/2